MYAYYFDEPELNYIPIGLFSYVNDYINEFTNSKFGTGDIKPVSCLDPYVNIADYVMCTKYRYGTDQGFCIYTWWPEYDDQRPLWASFKNRYGSKNSTTWIGAHRDLAEYNYLLNFASILGYNTVWLYASEDVTDDYSDNNIWQFSNNAWQAGYLRRYSQKVTSYYKCYSYDCATCESEEGIWILYNTIYGEIREDVLY